MGTHQDLFSQKLENTKLGVLKECDFCSEKAIGRFETGTINYLCKKHYELMRVKSRDTYFDT